MSKRNAGQFKKGQSGNPGGRPKEEREVIELARKLSKAALATLAEIMRDPKAHSSARARAADIILDRAIGKPRQTIDSTVDARVEGSAQVIILPAKESK